MLAAHTGLRRGSLFNLRWDQVDFANRVMWIPRTKRVGQTLAGIRRNSSSCLQRLAQRSGPLRRFITTVGRWKTNLTERLLLPAPSRHHDG